MENVPDESTLLGVTESSIPHVSDLPTSGDDVDAVKQVVGSDPEEKATVDGSDSGGLHPTINTLASDIGSNPVQHAEKEAELVNPMDSSNNNTHLTSTAADSTSNILMNEPEASLVSLDEPADHNATGDAQAQPLKSPLPDDFHPTSVDIQALLETIPIHSTDNISTTNYQTENGKLSTPTHPDVPIDTPLPTNGEESNNQQLNALGDLPLPALMQSNQAANVSLPPTIPAPILTTGSNGLPPPPSASFQQSLPQSIPLPPIPGVALPSKATIEDDGPFPTELEGPYEEFLRDERTNLNEGNWEKFPDGSRLFIGNLPTEKVSKRDVFRRFYRYGKLAQISLKQAYGFVQYSDAESCSKAKDAEQDTSIKGRKIHLEISRPNRGGKDRQNRRRSRSPDYNRNRGDRYSGGTGGGSGGSGGGAGGARDRERDYRRNRDDYRPNRSPSPRGYRRGRSPDHYDPRRRSRSRSPYRDSHQKPGMPGGDDLPLPHRLPHDVPEVQVIVVEDLSREFIAYAESAIRKRGLRCDVLILSPRLSEDAVIRRQIVEGVLAVVRLSRVNQATGKIPVRLFNRSGGAENVNFEDYENLDPAVAAEVIFRAKSTHAPPPQTYPNLPATPYAAPPSYGIPPGGVNSQPDLSALLSQLGSRPDAQSLLNTLQSHGQMPSQQAGNLPPGISQQLLATLGNQPAPGYDQTPNNQSHFALASLLGSQPSMAQNPGVGLPPGSLPQGQNSKGQTPDMQEIMAQLAKYQR